MHIGNYIIYACLCKLRQVFLIYTICIWFLPIFLSSVVTWSYIALSSWSLSSTGASSFLIRVISALEASTFLWVSFKSPCSYWGRGGGKEREKGRERDYAREEENNVLTSSTFVFCFERCISSALYTLQSLTYKSQKPIQINCHTAYYILQRLRGNS